MTDGDSGLVPMYIGMQSRHYDPTIGRFIQADSLSLGSLTTQGMNRYVYTENDPVNNSDPTGQYALFVFGLVVAALLGGLFSWTQGGSFWAGAAGGAATTLAILVLGPYVGLALAGAIGGVAGAAITGLLGAGPAHIKLLMS